MNRKGQLKIQQELIKEAMGRDYTGKPFRSAFFEANGKMFVCPHGYFAMWIPDMYLDIDKIFRIEVFSGGEELIRRGLSSKPAICSEEIVVMEDKQLRRFIVGNEFVYTDDKYLKYFDTKTSVFTGNDAKSPIYVWEDDNIIGVILPVMYKGKGGRG